MEMHLIGIYKQYAYNYCYMYMYIANQLEELYNSFLTLVSS